MWCCCPTGPISDPEAIYRDAQEVHAGYYNFGKRTAGDFLARCRARRDSSATLGERAHVGRDAHGPHRSRSTCPGYAYTYLMNGITPAGNWTGLFERGERCGCASSMAPR